MSRPGYIKVWRQLTEHEMFRMTPFDLVHAWIDLLLKAAWKKHDVWFQSTAVTLDRGQLATTERQLGREWGWSRTKVQKYLMSLQIAAMISTRKKPRLLIITIVNYDTYQGEQENKGQRKADKEPTKGRSRADQEPEESQSSATREEVIKKREEVIKNGGDGAAALVAAPPPPPPEPPEEALPDSIASLVRENRFREAMTAAEDSGHLLAARRLAMRAGDVTAASRIAARIEATRCQA